MARRYRDEEWLRRKYWDEELTQREMAEECGVSPTTIREYMKEYEVPTREIEGENHPLHGEERDEKTKQQISETLSGRERSDEWRENIATAHAGTTLPAAVREKISESLRGTTRSTETRAKMSESTSGEANPNWRGGYSNRYGSGWSLVRQRIRERDEVCQECGHDGSENRLEVHHIVPVREFRSAEETTVEDAHRPENLVLLCKSCHGKADHGLLGLETDIERPTGTESGDSA